MVDIPRILQIQFPTKSKNFHCWLVIQDKTYMHHFEPESKIQNKHWKLKKAASVGKVIVSVLGDSEEVIMIDNLEKGKTINGQFYASE